MMRLTGLSPRMALRLIEVAQFNAANRYRKRGICVIPTKFGISFTALFMNQVGGT